MQERFWNRVKILMDMGLTFDWKQFYWDYGINVHHTEITCDTEEEFNKKIEEIKWVLLWHNNDFKPDLEILARGEFSDSIRWVNIKWTWEKIKWVLLNDWEEFIKIHDPEDLNPDTFNRIARRGLEIRSRDLIQLIKNTL